VAAGGALGWAALACSGDDRVGSSPTTLDPARSRYLQGPFAPVREEATVEGLDVDGTLPPELDGLYLRNGPNPWPVPTGHYEWFMGDGMVHGVRLSNGRAEWYRNRWIRTSQRGPDPGGPPEPFATGANAGNTSVVAHAGRILALYEAGLPHELDDTLATVGRFDFAGALGGPMTAHPKIDPVTGEMVFFGYIPSLVTYTADSSGRVVASDRIDVGRLTMMHDFSLTESSMVFFDLPVVFDASLLAGGAMPFRWQPETGARIGVVSRRGGAPVWTSLDPAFTYHTLNAHDVEGGVAIDFVRHDAAFADGEMGTGRPQLHRWTVRDGRVGTEQLSDRPMEFPKVDPRVVGRSHRFGWSVALDDVDVFAPAILAMDLDRGVVTEHRFADGDVPGEPTFVPSGAGEGEGWLLSYVLHDERGSTDLVVLDAGDVRKAPVATVRLPLRVPVGFHGTWVPLGA
jgi:carotenoid cleavage dioxygenase